MPSIKDTPPHYGTTHVSPRGCAASPSFLGGSLPSLLRVYTLPNRVISPQLFKASPGWFSPRWHGRGAPYDPPASIASLSPSADGPYTSSGKPRLSTIRYSLPRGLASAQPLPNIWTPASHPRSYSWAIKLICTQNAAFVFPSPHIYWSTRAISRTPNLKGLSGWSNLSGGAGVCDIRSPSPGQSSKERPLKRSSH